MAPLRKTRGQARWLTSVISALGSHVRKIARSPRLTWAAEWASGQIGLLSKALSQTKQKQEISEVAPGIPGISVGWSAPHPLRRTSESDSDRPSGQERKLLIFPLNQEETLCMKMSAEHWFAFCYMMWLVQAETPSSWLWSRWNKLHLQASQDTLTLKVFLICLVIPVWILIKVQILVKPWKVFQPFCCFPFGLWMFSVCCPILN